MRVVFDTDVVSAVFRGRLPAHLIHLIGDYQMVITLVTVGELWTWAEQRSWTTANRDRLTSWLDAAEVIDWDMAVAKTWGALMGRARRRGRPRPVNDTWIAAGCLAVELPLLTLNRRDFEDFATHEGLRLIETRPAR